MSKQTKSKVKSITVNWKDEPNGSASITFDTDLKAQEAVQVLVGGTLSILGIEDHSAVVDVIRVLNKYSNGGGATKKADNKFVPMDGGDGE